MAEDPILELLTGKQAAPDRLVGAEFERFGLNARSEVLQYSRDLRPLLEELNQKHCWEVVNEFEGQILGLKKARHYLSLEPGAQLEIAAAPKESLLDVQKTERRILADIRNTETARDWTWVELGVNPWSLANEIELIPSPRYQYMTEYFPSRGARGLDMMRLTTGTHLNIDFYMEVEAVEMLRVGAYLSPFITALFANSPWFRSQKSSAFSERTLIWMDTDPIRSGFPEFLFGRSVGLEDYSRYVRSLPLMYFLNEDSEVVKASGENFDSLPVELKRKNAILALRQVFTESRLKPCCVEIRGFDQLPEAERYAALAFAMGLVYDDEIRQELNEEALSAGRSKLMEWLKTAALESLKNDFLFEKCVELYDRARTSLLKRGLGEETLLEPAKQLLEKRMSPAQIALAEARIESWR